MNSYSAIGCLRSRSQKVHERAVQQLAQDGGGSRFPSRNNGRIGSDRYPEL